VLSDIVEPVAGGKAERVTPLGYKTAVRAQPRILAKLAKSDPRLKAATMLAGAVERVGSVKGADLGGTDSKAGVSDGGATTRVKHAAHLNIVEALSNGWLRDARGHIQHGPARVLMPLQRQRGNRQEIKAFPALCAVCVYGKLLDDLPRAHGWSAQTANRKALGDAFLVELEDVAEGLGLGGWDEGLGLQGVDE